VKFFPRASSASGTLKAELLLGVTFFSNRDAQSPPASKLIGGTFLKLWRYRHAAETGSSACSRVMATGGTKLMTSSMGHVVEYRDVSSFAREPGHPGRGGNEQHADCIRPVDRQRATWLMAASGVTLATAGAVLLPNEVQCSAGRRKDASVSPRRCPTGAQRPRGDDAVDAGEAEEGAMIRRPG